MVQTLQCRTNTAYHEAGHALVALHTLGALRGTKASVIPVLLYESISPSMAGFEHVFVSCIWYTVSELRQMLRCRRSADPQAHL